MIDKATSDRPQNFELWRLLDDKNEKNQFEFTQIVRLVLHTNYEFYNVVQIRIPCRDLLANLDICQWY